MISRKLNPIANQQVKQGLQASGVTSFTADIDAMMIESEKKTAEMTYKGFAGYNTMLGFFAETGHCGYQSFRTGNTSPAYGILAALQGMRQNCPKGTDIHRFRSDSAGWSADVLGYWALSQNKAKNSAERFFCKSSLKCDKSRAFSTYSS
jgi:hypothetical protein